MLQPADWSRPRRVLAALVLLAFVGLAWRATGAFFEWASAPASGVGEE
jgi:hypothetical protein